MAGVGIWIFDSLFKLILVIINANKTKRALITVLPGDIIRIVFDFKPNQSIQYQAGQYIFICIPSINCYEWHPFSISSSPNENEFSLHFSVKGRWTQMVKDAVLKKGKKMKKKEVERSLIRLKTLSKVISSNRSIKRGLSNNLSKKESLNISGSRSQQNIHENLKMILTDRKSNV